MSDHNQENNHYRKSASPDRKVSQPAEKLPGGRSPGAGGPGPGGGPGGGGGGETERGGGISTKQDSGKVSMTLTKRDLLNQMVSQTKQHRQQIRTLENELERLRSGDVLNKCEVNISEVEWRPADVVGEGSFSTVYKGTYCGTEVAVKELKFKLSQDDKNYFRSEAALLQQLHHPRIVLMMGVCTGSARPFMLLEYLAGGTLYNLIHTPTRDKLDHAAYFVVAKDIAQGMNYLHRHDPQVLHLDLKSMNVLLDSYMRAKIADFGFSILRRSRSGSPQQRGSIRGTPAWMAPELLTKGEVSAKCDVYSFAIILWEMLTSSHPFKGLDIFQIMERTESGGRPTLPVSRMSRELKELITSCWAQNPSLRPSFEEILGALETAAIPSSWRGLLQKANIKSSQLSDVAAARTIISVVEQSVELVRRSLQQQRANKNRELNGRELDEREYPANVYDTLETDVGNLTDILKAQPRLRGMSSSRGGQDESPRRQNSPYRRSSPTRHPYTRDVSQGRGPNFKKNQTRDFSPHKEGVRRSSSKVSRTVVGDVKRRQSVREQRHSSVEHINRMDRSRQRRKESYSEEVARYRNERSNSEKYSKENDRRRNGREREYLIKSDIAKVRNKSNRDRQNYDIQKNLEYEKSNFNRGKKEPKQIIERRSNNKAKAGRKKRSRSLESSVRYNDIRMDGRSPERHYSGASDRYSDLPRDRNYKKKYEREQNLSAEPRRLANVHRRNHERLADSRDSLGDSQNESWTSIEGSSYGDSNNPSDEFEDHYIEKAKRRHSPSPRRASPERHLSPSPRKVNHHSPEQSDYNYSPERRRSPRSPARRRVVDSRSQFGPLMVTSEQLLSQKQRLRPVRPSELTDLTNMPENSLNDISVILKTAITKRRNALDEGMSGRDSFRSEFEWSDWH
ncbi:uncharacterized protein [Palaemon carinicauda]|uniref:uncharacterized protein n=1 Tax=Palaemon carinicauda TaxID=392227 RepID=UPI0035B59A81